MEWLRIFLFIIGIEMYYIPIQPLSQNLAWAGKRYKSKKYRQYEKDINTYLHTLPLPKIKPKTKFYIFFEFGIPQKQDCTNGIKLLEDLIADFLGINDRDVMALYVRKIPTKKTDSFIKFNIFEDEYNLIRALTDEV